VRLKTALTVANRPIQQLIFELAECKALVAMLGRVNTRHGVSFEGMSGVKAMYVAQFRKPDIDREVRRVEREIDRIQDELDQFNHRTPVGVGAALLALAEAEDAPADRTNQARRRTDGARNGHWGWVAASATAGGQPHQQRRDVDVQPPIRIEILISRRKAPESMTHPETLLPPISLRQPPPSCPGLSHRAPPGVCGRASASKSPRKPLFFQDSSGYRLKFPDRNRGRTRKKPRKPGDLDALALGLVAVRVGVWTKTPPQAPPRPGEGVFKRET